MLWNHIYWVNNHVNIPDVNGFFFNKYFIFKIFIQYEVFPLFHKSAKHKSNMEFITVRFVSIWNKKEAYVWILIRIILKIIWNNPNWQDILFPTHWTLRLCTVAFRHIFELLLSVKNILAILGQQQRNTFCLKAWLLYTVFYLTRINQILNLNLDENENLTWIFNDNISIYLSLYHFTCNLFRYISGTYKDFYLKSLVVVVSWNWLLFLCCTDFLSSFEMITLNLLQL